METAFTFNDIKAICEKPVILTVGMYDGVHLGHQKVIAEAKRLSLSKGTHLLTITFSNHPIEILKPGASRTPIYPIELKCELLASLGVDNLLLLPFTEELARQTAAEFIDTVYEQQPISDIVLGYDATFGSDQENNRQHVINAANQYHADVHYISAYTYENLPVSSRRIRALLEVGNFMEAEKLLGRPFTDDYFSTSTQ